MNCFQFDFFSPNISLFRNKVTKHSNIPSIIISYISILAIIIITIKSLIKMFQRKKFSAYYYDSYLTTPPDFFSIKKVYSII